MVCVSADNPAVTTVLELTEANCVPSNQNITVQVQARASVTPQLYARDLAITAVICFIGENDTHNTMSLLTINRETIVDYASL